MQNVVPLENELADQTLAARREQYATEVRALIDAAFSVMARTGELDPPVRDIVRAAGSSNQVFYRHFASKDALLLAALSDGQRQLLEYLQRRLDKVSNPKEHITRWIEGVMAQARNTDAAEATRPFAINGPRLADRFPAALAESRAVLVGTLAPAVRALGGTDQDAEFVHDLTIARMNAAIAYRRRPTPREVEHLVQFCLAGVADGT